MGAQSKGEEGRRKTLVLSSLKQLVERRGLDPVSLRQKNTDRPIDNVRPCCKICNNAKDAITEEEFMQWLSRLVDHISSK